MDNYPYEKPVGTLGRYEDLGSEPGNQGSEPGNQGSEPRKSSEVDTIEKVWHDFVKELHRLVHKAHESNAFAFAYDNESFRKYFDRIAVITAKETSWPCDDMPFDPHEVTVFGMTLEEVQELKRDKMNLSHDCQLLWKEKRELKEKLSEQHRQYYEAACAKDGRIRELEAKLGQQTELANSRGKTIEQLNVMLGNKRTEKRVMVREHNASEAELRAKLHDYESGEAERKLIEERDKYRDMAGNMMGAAREILRFGGCQ